MLEIEIHSPLKCDNEKRQTLQSYPKKATNTMENVWRRLGSKNKKYSFVFHSIGTPFHIRVILDQGESIDQVKDSLKDLMTFYDFEFFIRV